MMHNSFIIGESLGRCPGSSQRSRIRLRHFTRSLAGVHPPTPQPRSSPEVFSGSWTDGESKTPSARQLLGGISSGSYYTWKKQTKRGYGRTLDQDTLTRISLLLGIFKALNILYSEQLADAWITLPNRNPMFRGQSPLAYMIERGQPGMLRLRQMLDARRGG